MTKKYNATKWLAVTALLTALVIATSAIPPLPVGVGRIYWCDCMILIAAFLADPVSALIAGGVGTLLYDIIGGSPQWLSCRSSFTAYRDCWFRFWYIKFSPKNTRAYGR